MCAGAEIWVKQVVEMEVEMVNWRRKGIWKLNTIVRAYRVLCKRCLRGRD